MDRCWIKIITGSCLLKSKQTWQQVGIALPKETKQKATFPLKPPQECRNFPSPVVKPRRALTSASLCSISPRPSGIASRIASPPLAFSPSLSLPPALRRDADSRGADDGDDANVPRRGLGISFSLRPFPRGARRLSAGVVIFYRVPTISFSSS